MKKYFSGVVTGCIIGLILATTTFAFGADPIKLMVNGKLISFPDAPPQIVNGRTMVPARPLAEALGANVAWDDANRTVVVTGGVYTDGTPTDLPAVGQPGKAVD
ncbi:copper amine oxidase N-terminal domain-containing protein, partial [bacterium]